MNELDIFSAALELDTTDERERYLSAACRNNAVLRAKIDALLKSSTHVDSFLESPPIADLAVTLDRSITEGPGTVIGPYKLRESLGEGGMGSVFVAEQDQPIRRKVALKIIKPGMDSRDVLGRFEAERQALAMMDHPNIAKALDAGTTESGRPYFVMELVRGVPITEFCDQRDLTARERLELFVEVCRAIHHAHQKGIIHRDIKPSNVLVTLHDDKAVPKVIDFGIAKATSQRLTEQTVYTAFTQMVGTPLYMSPEQAEMNALDVDTRSDVYSLGVLLYELLTGTTPFDKETLSKAGLDEMRRMIREDEPPRPSARVSTLKAPALSTISQRRSTDPRRISATLRGELDWIVMKALEKDRSRRYESASAFASDIQRYLSDEPVLACPPTTMYRFQKFARKHKPALATAAAIAACLLLGTTVSAWQAARATTAEAQANANANQAQERAQEATTQRDEAQKQRDEVRALNERLQAAQAEQRRTLYAANMILAQRAWDASDPDRVRELLDQQRPQAGQADLRGFEWHYLNRLCHAEIFTVNAQKPGGGSLTYSPDGKRLATAERGGTVKVVDAQSGQVLLTFETKGFTSNIVFSPDGQRLATTFYKAATKDRLVKVWDAQTGAELLALKGHTRGVNSVAYLSDGKRLASVSGGLDDQFKFVPGELKVWDAASGQELLSVNGGGLNLACSPDGKRLAVVNSSSPIKILDAESGRELLAIKGGDGNDSYDTIAFSPDGQRLVGRTIRNGEERTVRVWDAQTGQELRVLPQSGDVLGLAYSPDGKLLAGGTGERVVSVWDAETGEPLFDLKGHASPVHKVEFSPDGKRLAGVARDGHVKVWDVTANPEARIFREHTSAPVNMAFGTMSLASLSASGGRNGSIYSTAFSPDGRRMAVAGDRVLKVWDAKSGRELLAIRRQPSFLDPVAFSPDGKGLACLEGKTPKMWNSETGQELLSFQGHTGNIASLIFSPSGDRLASAASDNTVKVWDVKSGEELFSYPRQIGDIWVKAHSLAFSPDGKRLASTSGDLKVWDVQTGQEVLTIQDTESVSGVAFSPDGMRLASFRRLGYGPSGTGEVKVWDAHSGQGLMSLRTHTAGVGSVAFSPDGKRIASGSGGPSQGGEVKVWDAETAQELLMFKVGGFGHDIAFSPDGHWLASRARGTLRIFDATPLPEKP